MTTEKTSISLPEPIVEQCEARIEGTEFESVEEYVQFVMAAVVESDDASTRTDSGEQDRQMSSTVEDRLSSLGYR